MIIATEESLGEPVTRKVKLKEAIQDCWNAGKFRKSCMLEKKPSEAFSSWKNRLTNINSFAKEEARKFATGFCGRHQQFIEQSYEAPCWMLMTAEDITVGQCYQHELKKGDIVEYAFETVCKVTNASYQVPKHVADKFPNCRFAFVTRMLNGFSGREGTILGHRFGIDVSHLANVLDKHSPSWRTPTGITSDIKAAGPIKSVSEKDIEQAIACELLDVPVGELFPFPKDNAPEVKTANITAEAPAPTVVNKMQAAPEAIEKNVVAVGDAERPATEADIKEVQEQLAKVANDPNLTLVTHGPILPLGQEINPEHKTLLELHEKQVLSTPTLIEKLCPKEPKPAKKTKVKAKKAAKKNSPKRRKK
jgi:hypothetical protein